MLGYARSKVPGRFHTVTVAQCDLGFVVCCFGLLGKPDSNHRAKPDARTWPQQAHSKELVRFRIHSLSGTTTALGKNDKQGRSCRSSPKQNVFLGGGRT